MTPTHIYELVDCTDEENYYPLGIWSDIDEATIHVKAIASPANLIDHANEDDMAVELRERPVGFGCQYRVILKRRWSKEYDEAKDEYEWKEHA